MARIKTFPSAESVKSVVKLYAIPKYSTNLR